MIERKKERIIISVFLISVLLLSPASLVAVAAKPHTITVSPNGTDDTANIQAAFNACVTYGHYCTVQLQKGTYFTKQIAVNGFQGSFVGMGQGLTTVQALPNLPPPTYNTPTSPFWVGLPGPANPWPVLFTFVNGSFGISQMTFNEPYYSPISSPGWYFPDGSEWYSLAGMVYIVGQQANVVIDRVTVHGAAGNSPFGDNINNAIYYEGFTLPKGYAGSNPIGDAIPLSGTISVTNSEFNTVVGGPQFENLVNARVTACSNSFDNALIPIFLADVSSTTANFCLNHATDVSLIGGIIVQQGVYESILKPSTVYITGNSLQADQSALGIYLADYVASGLSAVVIGNTVTGSYTGVWVDFTNGVLVAGNAITKSAQWGIAITDGSSHNIVLGNHVTGSGAFDLYWDQTGTGNIWHGNHCQTSSPSGLC